MFKIGPDTRTRVDAVDLVDVLSGMLFEGDPYEVNAVSARTGMSMSVTPTSMADANADEPDYGIPDLYTCEWVIRDTTLKVAAQLELVGAYPCTVDDILDYRADQYSFRTRVTEEQAFAARAKALEVIERECRRHLQPVMRTGWLDRPGCTTRTMAMGEDGYISDLISVNRAVDGAGADVALKPARPGSDYIDVTPLRVGEAAEVVVTCGMRSMPAELRPAVIALAASYLAPKTAPENATSTSTEAGVLSFVIGGVNGATSIPEVNALISRYRRPGYTVG